MAKLQGRVSDPAPERKDECLNMKTRCPHRVKKSLSTYDLNEKDIGMVDIDKAGRLSVTV